MEILVFATNIDCKSKVKKARRFLDNLPGIRYWTVDFQDCDHVLRVENLSSTVSLIRQTLGQAGFRVTEL